MRQLILTQVILLLSISFTLGQAGSLQHHQGIEFSDEQNTTSAQFGLSGISLQQANNEISYNSNNAILKVNSGSDSTLVTPNSINIYRANSLTQAELTSNSLSLHSPNTNDDPELTLDLSGLTIDGGLNGSYAHLSPTSFYLGEPGRTISFSGGGGFNLTGTAAIWKGSGSGGGEFFSGSSSGNGPLLYVDGDIQLGNTSIPTGFTTGGDNSQPILNMDINFNHDYINNNYTGGCFRIDVSGDDMAPLFQWHMRAAGDDDETMLMTLQENGDLGVGIEEPACKLDVAGDICANGVLVNSDRRFKKNITAIENAIERLVQLEGVHYYMDTEAFPSRNFSNNQQTGLVAQDVALVFPNLVDTHNGGFLAIHYEGLIPFLIEALKEEHAVVTEQESRITSLENKLLELEKIVEKLNTFEKE